MFEYGHNEGVTLERATYGLEVGTLLASVSIHAEACLGVEVELLAGIVIDHVVEVDDGFLPVIHDASYLVEGDVGHRMSNDFFYLAGSPCPLVCVVVLVHVDEPFAHLFERELILLKFVEQFRHFALGRYQSC